MFTKRILKLKYLNQLTASHQANAVCKYLSLSDYPEAAADGQHYVVEKIAEFYRA